MTKPPPDSSVQIRQAGQSGAAGGAPLRSATTRSRAASIAAAVLIVGTLVAWGATRMLSIEVPHGVPLGDSVRAGGEIATLIETLQSYVPSLHRNPDNDRYSLSLFLYPVDGSAAGRTIPLVRDLRAQEASHTRVLGGDERIVWFDVNGIGGVRPATGERIGIADLRAANPNAPIDWDDTRRFSFEQRLRVEAADRRAAWDIDSTSLAARPVTIERTGGFPLRREVQAFLASGVRLSPTEWLGLHSSREAARDFKPRAWLTRSGDAADAKESRRFHRGALGPELDRGHREIVSMTPLPGDEYQNAAFIRGGANAEPLRLDGEGGFLMLFTSAPGLAGTAVVARVDRDGRLAWRVDTGIDRFKLSQILPDARRVAFRGTRPPVPGKVPEPILVTIDTRSGASFTTTLWK